MEPIRVIGMGPGSEEYLLPVSRDAALECEILFGAQRHLDLFESSGAERRELTGASDGMIAAIAEARSQGRTGVLVSGDPALYSYLRVLQRHFSRSDLAIYPGVSSIHVAACRLGISLEDAIIASVHGRELSDLDRSLTTGAPLFILTDKSNSPARVTEYLSTNGAGSRQYHVCENLTLPDERVSGPFRDPVTGEHQSLSIVVVEAMK